MATAVFHRALSTPRSFGVTAGLAEVKSIAVYAPVAQSKEPTHYWLLPNTLCVVLGNTSVYITLKEKESE